MFGSLSSDGILLFNVKTRKIDYINRALVELFDISHDAFTHQAEFFMSHIVENDLDYLRIEYDTLMKKGRVENVEFAAKTHDGSIRKVWANSYLIEQEKYVVGFFKDITVLRQHEEYIIDYGAKKNTLLDMVTHNLSGPLAISQNLLNSLANVAQGDTANVQKHIQLIRENTSHCIEIVNEFLEEEHLVSSNIVVRRSRFELFTKLDTILERIRKGYPDFTFTVSANTESLNVSLDEVKFLQVVNNLMSNAIKWSPAHSTITIRVDENGELFSLSVLDTGVGIPQHLQRFVFDKNSRASRKGLRGEKSIGMGLYIVKKLVALMDGEITFESEEGKGSIFTLTFRKDNLVEQRERHSASNLG